MAFPYLLTNDPNNLIGYGGYPGPILAPNSARYVIATSVSDAAVEAWKSVDDGVTWSMVALGPQIDTSDTTAIASVLVGTKIYTFGNDSNTSTAAAAVFDTTTDTWGAEITSTNSNYVGNLCSADYRPGDNTIIFASQPFSFIVGGIPRTGYYVFDIATLTIGPWQHCGLSDDLDDRECYMRAVIHSSGMTHFAMAVVNGTANSQILHQALLDNGTLGAVQVVTTADNNQVAPVNLQGSGRNDIICLAWWPYNFPAAGPTVDVNVFIGASAENIAFTQVNVTPPGGLLVNCLTVFQFGSGTVLFMMNSTDGVSAGPCNYTQNTGTGAFGTLITLGNLNIEAVSGRQINDSIWGLVMEGGFVDVGFPIYYWEQSFTPVSTVPVLKATTGGGTYFPRFVSKTLLQAQIARIVGPDNIVTYREFAPLSWLFDFPNEFDVCLSREWRLYNQIDPKALSCARKPECFSGEQGARPWVEPPPGAITFNPDKAIPLPDPADTDVVVLSFRVPLAYDGILLAQYHAYRGSGTFVEGSGDIIWRVRVNGRYLRDMGNMQVSIGSPQTLSPCPGGLWLHSGNLVEYVVSAPNGTGNLPLPGQGNILAGLHGWFFPRI